MLRKAVDDEHESFWLFCSPRPREEAQTLGVRHVFSEERMFSAVALDGVVVLICDAFQRLDNGRAYQ